MNKKLLIIPAALLMTAGLASCNNSGGDTQGHLVTYNVEDGLCVASLSNTRRDKVTEIKVPNKINGKKVVEISKGAFKGCSSLRSISLPFIGHKSNSDGIAGLFGYVFGDEMYDGGGAFTWQCYGLGNRYDDGVTDYHNFAIPNSLHTVTITGGDYISAGAFSKCTSLRDITITDGNLATEIGNYAFYDCTSLKSFTIPSKITTIGRKAFQRCYNLQEIIIPEGVTTVRHNAFSKCISASKAVIPTTVDEMGKLVFEDFISGLILTELKEDKPNWDKEWANSTASIVYDYHEDSMIMTDSVQLAVCGEGSDKYFFLVQYVGTWEGEKILVPGTITVNGLTLPLKKIGSSVFMENTYVKELEIQEGVEVIGAHAFATCINLQKISLPDSLKEIGAYAFYDCRKLGYNNPIDLKHVKKIDAGAFMGCYSEDEFGRYGIRWMDLGDSLEEIGESAFEDDELLIDSTKEEDPTPIEPIPETYEFKIPKSVRKIGTRAFYNTFKISGEEKTVITNIKFDHEDGEPSKIEEIGESAFELMGVSNETKTRYPQYSQNVQISIDLANLTLRKIPDRMFYLTFLRDITNFPDETLYEIGEYAFYFAYGGQNATTGSYIKLGKNVTTINKYAFYNCYYVEFNLLNGNPNSDEFNITTISDYAFNNCYNANNITLKIPDSVETMGPAAFNGCSALKDIKFPNANVCKITRLESSVFASCSGLGKDAAAEGYTFNLPSTITYIGSSAFASCTNLQHIVFNNDEEHPITTVGGSAFNNCTALVDVTFKGPGLTKCTSFGGSVYYNCTQLASPVYPPNYTSIASNSFYSCLALTTFNVSGTVTSINERAFFNCEKLATITGATSVATIGAFAFSGCKKLESFPMPTSVSTIADSAFANCETLGTAGKDKFILPTAITTSWTGSKGMGANVFSGWDGDQTIYFNDSNIIGGYSEQETLTTLWGWTLKKVTGKEYYLNEDKKCGSGTVHFAFYAPTI